MALPLIHHGMVYLLVFPTLKLRCIRQPPAVHPMARRTSRGTRRRTNWRHEESELAVALGSPGCGVSLSRGSFARVLILKDFLDERNRQPALRLECLCVERIENVSKGLPCHDDASAQAGSSPSPRWHFQAAMSGAQAASLQYGHGRPARRRWNDGKRVNRLCKSARRKPLSLGALAAANKSEHRRLHPSWH